MQMRNYFRADREWQHAMNLWQKKILIVAPIAVAIVHLLHATSAGPERGVAENAIGWALWLLNFTILPAAILTAVSFLSAELPSDKRLAVLMVMIFFLDLLMIGDMMNFIWSSGIALNLFPVFSIVCYVSFFVAYFIACTARSPQ